MAGIAGVLKKGQKQIVSLMLNHIRHRGNFNSEIVEFEDATIGINWLSHENKSVTENLDQNIFMDGPGYGHYSKVVRLNGEWVIFRDELGVAPMYYTKSQNGTLYFASEVKALLVISNKINELQPGHTLTNETTGEYFHLLKKTPSRQDPENLASELGKLLRNSIRRRISSEIFGSWLSGGLDSSTIAALAKPMIKTLHTFSGGLKNAPDLKFAKETADFIGSIHHEMIIKIPEVVKVLPEIIYHLESFDALLVRSSIVNYFVSRLASDYVGEVFSGEGGDELFAGYNYLKSIPLEKLDNELINLTKHLHNTALQRVDRSATAHGCTAHVVFVDSELFDFAMGIPVKYKLKDGIEKWILRKSINGLLPDSVLTRTKAKFWEGAGIGELISEQASAKITDHDFKKDRYLKNGWVLNTKEELFYYRIFREVFGELEKLDWMGRTRGAPIE